MPRVPQVCAATLVAIVTLCSATTTFAAGDLNLFSAHHHGTDELIARPQASGAHRPAENLLTIDAGWN